jgi:DNA-binding FadR family transcriptional regulator
MNAQAAPRDAQRTETLYITLLRRILSGELLPGSRLPSERELADTYGTNRNTLREAIRRLIQADLVAVRHGQGVTVRDFRKTASLDLLGAFLAYGTDAREKARVVLDLLAPRVHVAEMLVSLAAVSSTDEDLERQNEIIAALTIAESDLDARAHADAQIEWLEAIIDCTHNMPVRWTANPMVAALRDVMLRYPSLVVFSPSYASYAADVSAACAARDRDVAVAATRAFHHQVDRKLRKALLPLLRGETGR